MLLDNKTKMGDNEHYKVCEFIASNTKNGALDIVTGYFSVNALEWMKDNINAVEKFRIILGKYQKGEAEIHKVVNISPAQRAVGHVVIEL